MNETNDLTPREKEVLGLIVKGKRNSEIAKILMVSNHTIKAHTESIFRKLNVHNKVQAAVCAIMNNLLD